MGQPQILEKLGRLLGQPITEEAQVVYLLVQIRKTLAREAALAGKCPLLKFYADWAVHSEKDKITPEIDFAAKVIYEAAVKNIENRFPELGRTAIEKFAHLDDLRAEMTAFLENLALPSDLIASNQNWLLFSNCLIKVLEEQPIRFKNGPIKSIQFDPSAPNCVFLRIEFEKPVQKYDRYKYGNVL